MTASKPNRIEPLQSASGFLEVTITFLEMTAAPAGPAPRRPDGAIILRARHPTVSFYRYLYNTVGEPWLWYERRRMDDDALATLLADRRIEIYVLHQHGVPAGYAELDLRRAGTVDLAYFGLIPEFIGCGLGPWFLRNAIDIAWTRHPRKLTVNTCSLDHPSALRVYHKAGFKPWRRERKVIADPRRDTGLGFRQAAASTSAGRQKDGNHGTSR